MPQRNSGYSNCRNLFLRLLGFRKQLIQLLLREKSKMAYAAVISLKNTINGLLQFPRISRVFSTWKILKLAYNHTKSLQQVLERSNDCRRSSSKRRDALEGQIRDCAHQLEDVLEFHDLNSQDKDGYDYQDLEEVRQAIASFAEKVKKMGIDYIQELSSPVVTEEDNDDDAAIFSSDIDSGVKFLIGRSNEYTSIARDLIRRVRPDDFSIFACYGEKGSGRTLAAKTIFDDLCKGRKQFFDCCAWVTINTNYQMKEVLIRIIAQVDNLDAGEYELLLLREDDKLSKYLNKLLENRRYMIVLDDVCDVQLVDYLKRSLPDQSNGSIVFLTTSFMQVAELADRATNFKAYSRFNQDYIWTFLRVPIYNFEPVYTEHKEAAQKILENCRGLPIAAAKALLFLMKAEKTVEKWSEIAADKENSIFTVVDEISEMREIKTELQSCNWIIDDRSKRIISKGILRKISLPEIVKDFKNDMYPERFFSKMNIISLLGMTGIGKTTLARAIFEDESNWSHFDHHVWVTLGPNYQTEEILIDVLAQIYPNIVKGDDKLVRDLCIRLSSKRCLIVLDDLWSKEPLDYLKNLCPDIKGTTFVTTTLAKVAKFERDDTTYQMQLLDQEESWLLLCQKVFGGGLCPPELEKPGRKIAEKCDGLPLLILTVGDQLLKVEISQENWNNVASGKQKSVFRNAHHRISKELLPSYENLPQHLKACFLYLGVFREKYEISISKLTDLLIAEGFLEPNSHQIIEDSITECLCELLDRSLVMVQHKVSNCQMKTCRLHTVFWHLTNSLALKNQFFHAMTSYDDCSTESIENQRRLCIRNSVLLGLKDVQDSMTTSISAHSLLCVSPFHQYPVLVNFDFRLLRVMNALIIRLFGFPTEVMSLVQLRYLSLTCNGKLPSSISNLWKLQYLIVKRYMNIKSSESSHALPMEIWDMKELKHLEVMGGRLPDNKSGDGLLKLSALLDISAESCREEVLEWIPNLKRLGIRIELAPNDEGNSFRYLNNISRLDRLESLKCVVVNPRIRSEFIPPVMKFPSSLKSLSLCGLGYPWEYMNMIGELNNLEVLKLKHFAFHGAEWEMDFIRRFNKLEFLLIQDTDLVHWKFRAAYSTSLKRLCIKHCYKLRELPIAFHIQNLRKIEIVDCNPLTETWAKQIEETLTASWKVQVDRSWIPKAHTKSGSQ